MTDSEGAYQRREPEKTILHQVVDEFADAFFEVAASDPGRKSLPGYVQLEFEKFLKCDILTEGFVRLKCSNCTESIIVAFSCKCRGFCPSCAGRRMAERSIYLADGIIPYVPTRHWVLSVPFELRRWIASDDRLLKKVNQILCDEIQTYLRHKARKHGIRGGEAGIVSFLQRAGSALNLNLHFHLLALDGLYVLDKNGHAIFRRIPGIHEHEVKGVLLGVSRRVIKYLRKLGKLSAEGENVYLKSESEDSDLVLSHIKMASISSRIALGPRTGLKVRRIGGSFGYEEEIPKSTGYGCASMNGFSIHAATSIKAHERDRLEQMLRYLGRGPLSESKVSFNEQGDILYELKQSFDGATHVLFSPLEFIEKLASIIPPPNRHQVNYYGCLSSHSRIRPQIVGGSGAAAEALEALEEKATSAMVSPPGPTSSPDENADVKKPSNYIPWAELLKRTFGFDLRVCPCCDGRLRVIAAVTGKDAIEKILTHLDLPTGPPTREPILQTEYVYDFADQAVGPVCLKFATI